VLDNIFISNKNKRNYNISVGFRPTVVWRFALAMMGLEVGTNRVIVGRPPPGNMLRKI